MSGNELKLRRAVEKHEIIGLDTAPLIYFIEDVAPYAELLDGSFALLEAKKLRAVTSTVSLAEILTKPLAEKKFALVDEIKFALKALSALSIVAVDEKLAEAAALIRARFSIRLPDAIQVAAAIQGGATLFVTNDKRIRKVNALEVLVLSDYLHS
jgi:predicted nucleic acid-binding protein